MMQTERVLALVVAVSLLAAGVLLVGHSRFGYDFWIGFGATVALLLALVAVGGMLNNMSAKG